MKTFTQHPQNKNILIYKKGKIYNKKTKQYIGRTGTTGHSIVDLRTNGKHKTFYIKHLVATAFLPNPKNLTDIIFINNHKWDCRLANLKWASRPDAIRHAKKARKRSGNKNIRTDEQNISNKLSIAKTKLPTPSSTFINDPNHPERIF